MSNKTLKSASVRSLPPMTMQATSSARRVGFLVGHDRREEHVDDEDARVGERQGRDDLRQGLRAQRVAVVVQHAADVVCFGACAC